MPSEYCEVTEYSTILKGDTRFIVQSFHGLCVWLKKAYGERLVTMASFGSHYDWILIREMFNKLHLDVLDYFTLFPFDIATLFQLYHLNPNVEFEKERFAGVQHAEKHH